MLENHEPMMARAAGQHAALRSAVSQSAATGKKRRGAAELPFPPVLATRTSTPSALWPRQKCSDLRSRENRRRPIEGVAPSPTVSMSASTKAAARYPGPSVALLTLWNAVFVVFTALQLVYNKTPLQVSGLPLLSVSDAIEFAVPLAVIPLYWAVWLSCFPEGVRPRFWVHLMPMIAGSALFTHGHGIHLAANSLSNSFVRLFPDKRGTPEATLMSALDLFDEHLSHMLWIGGLCFLEWAIVRVQLRLPSSNALHPARQTPAVWRPMSWVVLVASLALALVYGVLFFCHNIVLRRERRVGPN